MAPADITMDAISAVHTLHDTSHLQRKDVDPPSNIINTKDWSKTMEQIVKYLRDNRSLHGVPLSYVVQTDLEVADNPPDGWPNHLDEMIARAPIEDNQGVRNQDFLEDNNKVSDLIKKITYDHDC
jgi:hypothetical protein